MSASAILTAVATATLLVVASRARIARARGGAAPSSTLVAPAQQTSNEPAGMAAQINTGPISAVPPTLVVFSSSTPNAQGESRDNLATVPGGTGMRITYPATLAGGYSPVRFGMKIPSAGTGWYYQRMKVRFSPNWTLSGNVAMKFCEPRTAKSGSGAGSDENHVIGAHDFSRQSTGAFLYVLLQGPNRQSRNLFEVPRDARAANLNDGRWHLIELLFTPESSPGVGDGTYSGWVDGARIAHYTDVTWIARDNAPGWPYLMFDPTYGGGKHVPGRMMYWDFDDLYVSTR